MKKPRVKYMHTLDGKPATFDGYQIAFADRRPSDLCESLRAIRREQRITRDNRTRDGFGFDATAYSYVRVYV